MTGDYEFTLIRDGAMVGGKPKTPGLPVLLKLHGTGKSNIVSRPRGDKWACEVNLGLSTHPDAVFHREFVVEETQGYVRIDPGEHLIHPDTGGYIWGFWCGLEDNGILKPTSEEFVDAVIALCKEKYPHLDWSRIQGMGDSMGALGGLQLFPRRSYIASMHLEKVNPQYRALGSLRDGLGQGGAYRYPKELKHADGTDAWPYFDMLAYVDEPSNPMPMFIWNGARQDPSMPWDLNIKLIQAMRRRRRPFACAWIDGGHSEASIAGKYLKVDYPIGRFRLDESYPGFFNYSGDDDPMAFLATGQIGHINGGFAWRNIVDTPEVWKAEVMQKRATVETTVEVLPCNCQQFDASNVEPKLVMLPPKVWVTVEISAVQQPEEPKPATVEVVHHSSALGNMLVLDITHSGGDTYQRYQRLEPVLTPATASIRFACRNQGKGQLLRQERYELWINDTLHSHAMFPAGAKGGIIPCALSNYPQGYLKVEVRGNLTEIPTPEMLFLDRGIRPIVQSHMYVTSGTRDFVDADFSQHMIVKVTPAEFHPKVVPLPERDYQAFTDALPSTQLWCTEPVPHHKDHINRPSRHASGLITTRNRDPYDPEFFEPPLRPRMPVLDGARGRGNLVQATHMEVGRRGSCYFMDGQRFGIVEVDGHVRTLFGLRHKGDMPSQWQGAQDLELVGDWSAVPAERRFIKESWMFRWDPDSLALDPNAPPQGGEQPHLVGPRLLFTDALGRMLEATFDGKDRSKPPVIREFITGMNDSWSFVIVGQKLFICERGAHRIAIRDKNSGDYLGTLLQGHNLVSLTGTDRILRKNGRHASQFRAGICVGPEDIQVFPDGKLGFGSSVMAQIVKVDPETGAAVPYLNLPDLETKDGFVKFSLCNDGTVGEPGTVWVSTWRNTNRGFPRAYRPDGRHWDYAPAGMALGYTSTQAIGMRRIYASSSEEGLICVSKKLPTDIRDATRYSNGRRSYRRKGYHKTHGNAGWSWWNVPLPELTPDERYYLEQNGTL